MATTVQEPGVLERSTTPSPAHLASLARTFDRLAESVWIEDTAGRCVYRNACSVPRHRIGQDPSRVDICDHAGRVLARLNVARH